MPTYSSLGERVRSRRLAAGITQAELAAAVGIGVPYVSKLEADKERPSYDLLARLAHRFGVRVADLAGIAEVDMALGWLDSADRTDGAGPIVAMLVERTLSEAFR